MNETPDNKRSLVRERYGAVARGERSSPGCCSGSTCAPDAPSSLVIGYSADELAAVPDGADLGLGCGNPQAIAAIRQGETVIDLGSGGGFDCFLAARQTGPSGHVIGIDMTADMVARARANAAKANVGNVEFRLGEIEHLPVADSTADVILSNCVINLSPQKGQVFAEAYRVLKPGGRLAISDVIALQPLPPGLVDPITEATGCIQAEPVGNIEELLREAGFTDITVEVNPRSREFIREWAPGTGVEDYVASASIQARKPNVGSCCAPSCCDGESEE